MKQRKLEKSILSSIWPKITMHTSPTELQLQPDKCLISALLLSKLSKLFSCLEVLSSIRRTATSARQTTVYTSWNWRLSACRSWSRTRSGSVSGRFRVKISISSKEIYRKNSAGFDLGSSDCFTPQIDQLISRAVLPDSPITKTAITVRRRQMSTMWRDTEGQ